jgi:hypothetical protein
MIVVFDTAAARIALARRMLGCPGCGQPLRPWGHARERTVREPGGALAVVRPDRALCTGCGLTHVVLDAGLLPRRAYAAGLAGQALAAAALGHGHRRIACDLAVPAGTVRGWIRGARRSAEHHWHPGCRCIRSRCPAYPGPRGRAGLRSGAPGGRGDGHGERFGLQHTSVWARINVLTRGRLLTMAPAS